MRIKKGVSLRGVNWQMFQAAFVIDHVYIKLGYGEVIITSGSEGQHKHDTHADGYALDFRNRDIPREKRREVATACSRALVEQLGTGYDFVIETDPDHFHCEFDPRINVGGVD